MAVFTITYETSNYYSNPVRQAVFELMILPEINGDQRNISYQIQNSLDMPLQFSRSLFGASLVRFRVMRKFSSFRIKANISLEKEELNPFQINMLNIDEQEEILNHPHFKIDYHRCLSVSLFTSPREEKLPDNTRRTPGEDPFLYMQRINNWAYSYVKYEKDVTSTQTRLDEILRIKAGVCQDHAHLFIAIMRANGIPARYVSGYLSQGTSFNGTSAMHAWAEAFIPGIGWTGFDPSNNLLADVHYIKVGHGLDYTDCMPIKGVFWAKGDSRTEHSVKVVEQQTQ